MVVTSYGEESLMTRALMLRNINGQAVGKHVVRNTEKLISHWFGFLLWIRQSVEMEERQKKKTNIVTRLRMVHVAQSSGLGLKEILYMNVLNLLLVSVQVKSHRTSGQNHEHQAYNINGKVQKIVIRLCSFSVGVRNSLYNPCWYLWLLLGPVSLIEI